MLKGLATSDCFPVRLGLRTVPVTGLAKEASVVRKSRVCSGRRASRSLRTQAKQLSHTD